MENFILNVKNFALNFVDDITRAFKTNELSGNEEIVRKNLTLVNDVTKEDYLDNKYITKAKVELVKAQKHMALHSDDYISYFRNEYLNEDVKYEELYKTKYAKRKDYLKNIVLKKKYTKIKWVIGILTYLLIGGMSFSLGIILGIVNAFGLPYFYELYHKPYQEGKKRYNKILDNIKDKIDVIIEEEETITKTNSSKRVADLSLKIAACLELINKEPYPDCLKEQQALVKLNAEFLKDELANKTVSPDNMEPKLVFVSYESRLADIRKVILEKQEINRSRKLVEDKVIGSGLTLDVEPPVLDTPIPEVTHPQTLKRYRIKN